MLRTTSMFVRGAAIALAICSAPAYSFNSHDKTASIETRLAAFDPGDHAWHPEAAADGPVRVVVSIAAQVAFVFRGDILIGASTVSTGKPGHDTPVGRFPILQKRKVHHSNIYDGAPMPFMQRLTWDGVALHAGAIPGYPASHGCVRLPKAFAAKLFEVTRLGAEVVIVDEPLFSPTAALAMIGDGTVHTASAGQMTGAAP